MRDTNYAREIATASLDLDDGSQARVERIYVKELDQEEIRFSWWKGNRMVMRPLDLPEPDLLALITEGVRLGVFSSEFLAGLRSPNPQ